MGYDEAGLAWLAEALAQEAVRRGIENLRATAPNLAGRDAFHYAGPAARVYLSASTTAPAVIRAPPITVFRVSASPRNVAANARTKTTLSLSIGATFEASPT